MSKAVIGTAIGFAVGGPAGAAIGMSAGGQMDMAEQQAAVMKQNAAIAERDALFRSCKKVTQ
jgi:hypothetical protein